MEKVTYATSKGVLATAISFALTNWVYAEENSYFDEIVVWGTKVSSSSESVGANDMSLKQPDHMSDLLRDIPGVDVGGTHSVNQRINIRGIGETDLDIRLDGASQHANMFHHIGNLTLNPDILKQVDIEVGNNSVTQSGLGGSVYFETKDGKDLVRGSEQFGARVFAGYASNDSQQGSLTLYAMPTEKLDAIVYGHLVQRGNFEDGNGVETFGVEGDIYNIFGKVGFEPSKEHRFEVGYDLYRDSGDYNPRPDWSGNANQQISDADLIPTDYDRDTLTLSYQYFGENTHGKATLYSTKTRLTRDESTVTGRWPADRIGTNSAENKNSGLNVQFQSDFDIASFSHRLTYGLDYMDKNSASTYVSDAYTDENAISTAVFIENQWVISSDLLLTAGLRYDNYKRKATTGTHDFDDITWAISGEWTVAHDWTIFASTRTLFKGPELLESFIRYQDGTFLADDIKAESGRNTQAGVRFSRQLDQHYLGLTLTAFETTIDDYIAEAYQAATQSYLIYNEGEVEYQGFEFSTTYAYEAFSSKFSYSRSDNRNKSTGEPITGSSTNHSTDLGDSIALTLDYQSDSLDTIFGWTSIVVLDEENIVAGTPIKEGYNTHNIYAQWIPRQAEDLVVTFGIDNIFDEAYISHASTTGATRRGTIADDYDPGRNFKLSAAYQF
ncbi:TonB-dependent siderophore receptor [Vibrio sinensis]|uniref:TonB-dependent siderophore receptor n=1 Tax=Vibrio sinensis TaxID=2302434 RepID=A0A3A6QY14_9VIBR|nr:TonB-dependent siderophore receptor [Vibrio sinensis]RJX75426.1 TonB-dependent siderophore receptor [Vibrio sinensis]